MPEETTVDALLHVADIHFWKVVANPLRLLNKRFLGNMNVVLRRRHEFATHRADAFAEALCATGIPNVLFTGDFTSTSLEEEFVLARAFVEGVARRGRNVWVLPGNHDRYTFAAHRKRIFERHFSSFLPNGGYPALARLSGGTPLLLTPTATPNLLSSRGEITSEEMEKTVALLENKEQGPALVAGHYPLLQETPAYRMTWERRLRGAEAFRTALGSMGRSLLYVCGHVHRFCYVRDPAHANLEHVSTGALFHNSPKTGHQGEFSEIRVTQDGFRVFCHRFNGTWDRQAACLQSMETGVGASRSTNG